ARARRDVAMGIINRQVLHLGHLVDDLLDITRISQDKIQLQRRPVDLGQLVREAIEDNRMHIEARGVSLETRVVSGPPRATVDRASGGLGLGLALVRGLVELHGGGVTAYSAGSGQGATFVVRLPLAAAGDTAPGENAPPVAARRQRRVLVIDDNRDVANALRL